MYNYNPTLRILADAAPARMIEADIDSVVRGDKKIISDTTVMGLADWVASDHKPAFTALRKFRPFFAQDLINELENGAFDPRYYSVMIDWVNDKIHQINAVNS